MFRSMRAPAAVAVAADSVAGPERPAASVVAVGGPAGRAAEKAAGKAAEAGLTLPPPAMRSGAAWLASAPPEMQGAFLDGLSPNALAALPWLFEFWALPHQLPPGGDWRAWVILGGRGAGKTRAGAEWVRAQVEGAGPEDAGRCRRIALVGETMCQSALNFDPLSASNIDPLLLSRPGAA